MIKTNHIISDIKSVPVEWIFEHYLNLTEKLTGQDVNIKSVFNPKEKKPSMFIFFSHDHNRYLFKDYSTDRYGDAMGLVQQLLNLKTKAHAIQKIITDYSAYIKAGGKKVYTREYTPSNKYKLVEIEPRNWNVLDKKYWSMFEISSAMLTKYNIVPISSYTISNDINSIDIKGELIYGYFNKNNILYKIYAPYRKHKFFKANTYVQGYDQLTYKKPYLVICSSMKDLLAFNTLGFANAEAIAPDSENTALDPALIEMFKDKYKQICTLFDNDEAGLRAMHKYHELYNIPYVHLKLEKDLAKSVEEHGIVNTRYHLYPVITKALTGSAKKL
jgi:hypothetical protein